MRPSARLVRPDPARAQHWHLPSNIHPYLWSGALVLFMLVGIGENWELALLSVAALVVGASLLWRSGEVPILLFVFLYQWLQASLTIFRANVLDVPIEKLSAYGSDIGMASVLSIVGLTFLAIGMRLGVGPKDPHLAALMREQARSLPVLVWFKAYIAALIVANVALSFGWVIPGLSQLAIAQAQLKWAPYMMLIYATIIGGGDRRYALAAFAIELVGGIGGLFSDFKTVMIFTLMAYTMANVRLTARRAVVTACVAAMLFGLGIVWAAVKEDYRWYLTGGVRSQVVVVDRTEAASKLADLILRLDERGLWRGLDLFLSRYAYVDYFGVVINYVPDILPHEDGGLAWDAISRPFMPRLLFPDKTIVDDSARTNYYTGGLAGGYSDTSISIGHVAESYIDFGPYGMMPWLFCCGLFYGFIQRRFVSGWRTRGVLGSSLATAILFTAFALESSFTKTFGGIISMLLMTWLSVRYVVPVALPQIAGLARLRR